VFLSIEITLERFGGTDGRVLAVEASAAHDRLGLTHPDILRVECRIGNVVPPAMGPKASQAGGLAIPRSALLRDLIEVQRNRA